VIQSWMERDVGDEEDGDSAKGKGHVDSSMVALTGLQHL
jgi:hypothetical protein